MTTRRRIQKAREERLTKSLEAARDALSDIIDDIEMGQTGDVTDALEAVDNRLNRAYQQAERMEGER